MSEAEAPKRKYLEEMRPAAKRQKDSLWDDSDDASIYHINGQNFLTPEERVSRGLPPLPPEQAQAQFGSGEWRRSQAAANDTNASASS